MSVVSGQTLFSFGYLMVLVTVVTILRAVRDALFLDRIGYEGLPLIFLVTTIVSLVVASAYVRLAQRKSPVWIACFSTGLFALSFPIIYWWLTDITWPHYLFYVSVALFTTFSVLQFWALVHHFWEARRLEQEIPFIASGGLLGGILGGLLKPGGLVTARQFFCGVYRR